MYILVIMSALFVTTQEFYSKDRCEMAARLIELRLMDHIHYDDFSVKCYRK